MPDTSWQTAGLHAAPAVEGHPGLGVRLGPHGCRIPPWCLYPEQARSLARWLLATVGDREAPAEPDRVRAAVDDQRRRLAELSASAVSEEFRAALAWASRALDEIAEAAEGQP